MDDSSLSFVKTAWKKPLRTASVGDFRVEFRESTDGEHLSAKASHFADGSGVFVGHFKLPGAVRSALHGKGALAVEQLLADNLCLSVSLPDSGSHQLVLHRVDIETTAKLLEQLRIVEVAKKDLEEELELFRSAAASEASWKKEIENLKRRKLRNEELDSLQQMVEETGAAELEPWLNEAITATGNQWNWAWGNTSDDDVKEQIFRAYLRLRKNGKVFGEPFASLFSISRQMLDALLIPTTPKTVTARRRLNEGLTLLMYNGKCHSDADYWLQVLTDDGNNVFSSALRLDNSDLAHAFRIDCLRTFFSGTPVFERIVAQSVDPRVHAILGGGVEYRKWSDYLQGLRQCKLFEDMPTALQWSLRPFLLPIIADSVEADISKLLFEGRFDANSIASAVKMDVQSGGHIHTAVLRQQTIGSALKWNAFVGIVDSQIQKELWKDGASAELKLTFGTGSDFWTFEEAPLKVPEIGTGGFGYAPIAHSDTHKPTSKVLLIFHHICMRPAFARKSPEELLFEDRFQTAAFLEA